MNYKYLALLLISSIFIVAAAAQVYPIQIKSVTIRDYEGNVRTQFYRGEIVVIETELYYPPEYYYYPGGINYLEIITLWHDVFMYGLGVTQGTISSGQTKSFGAGIRLRFGDPTGTYRVKIFVWNGWPSIMGSNWKPLAEPYITEITVNP